MIKNNIEALVLIDSSNGEIFIFTDRSKSETGTGAGFFCSNLYTEGSSELKDCNSVYQAKILGITEGAKWAPCSNQ